MNDYSCRLDDDLCTVDDYYCSVHIALRFAIQAQHDPSTFTPINRRLCLLLFLYAELAMIRVGAYT